MRVRSGFTLAETLAALAVLALLTAGVSAGVSGLLSQRLLLRGTAHAEILGSTLTQILQEELRYGEGIRTEPGSVTLDSAEYGPGIVWRADDAGHLTAGDRTVPGLAAYGELRLEKLAFSESDPGVIQVQMAIRGLGSVAWEGTFTAVPLNGTEKSRTKPGEKTS